MLSYKDVLEGTTFQENDNFANGVRQLEWAAAYLRKLRIRTPAGQPDQFVVQACFSLFPSYLPLGTMLCVLGLGGGWGGCRTLLPLLPLQTLPTRPVCSVLGES